MARTAYLYHICRSADEFNYSVGYIGVSVTPKVRWKRHKSNSNVGEISHLCSAIRKYDDIIYYVVCSGTQKEMLVLEESLRPNCDMGWNEAVGGGMPPTRFGDNHWTSKVGVSLETRKLISMSKTGQEPWNKGKAGCQVAWNKGEPLVGDHRKRVIDQAVINQKKTIENSSIEVTCPHCGKVGKQSGLKSWHFDYCKSNPNRKFRR